MCFTVQTYLGTAQLAGQHKNQQHGDFEIAQRIVENPERTRDRVPSVQTVCRLRLEHLFRAKRHVRLQPFLSDLVGHVRPSVSVHVESKNRRTPGCTVKWSDFDRFADNYVRYYSNAVADNVIKNISFTLELLRPYYGLKFERLIIFRGVRLFFEIVKVKRLLFGRLFVRCRRISAKVQIDTYQSYFPFHSTWIIIID